VPAGRARTFLRSVAVRDAWRTFWITRGVVFGVAVFAALGGVSRGNAAKFDAPLLTHPFGGTGDALLSALARWDSVWFLSIADSGYGEGARAAFFPLFPGLARVGGELFGGGPGGTLLAAYAVSLGALLAAFVVFHRLVSLELGPRYAPVALLLIAVFPGALWLGAPYSESLFLAASVGAFYAARTGRWAWAGALGAAAAATRSAGVLLLVPLAVLYLWGPREDRTRPPRLGTSAGPLAWLRPRFSPRPDLAWLLLAPAGLGAYAAYLAASGSDALAFLDVQAAWRREFAGPLGGAWQGLTAAVDGVGRLNDGGTPARAGAHDLMLFGFLAFALVACVGVLRRLPFAYGAWTAVALMLPLSWPVGPQPLMSLPRFLGVLFPLFMWLALECEERRRTAHVAAAFALVLGLFVTKFATWHWVA